MFSPSSFFSRSQSNPLPVAQNQVAAVESVAEMQMVVHPVRRQNVQFSDSGRLGLRSIYVPPRSATPGRPASSPTSPSSPSFAEGSTAVKGSMHADFDPKNVKVECQCDFGFFSNHRGKRPKKPK